MKYFTPLFLLFIYSCLNISITENESKALDQVKTYCDCTINKTTKVKSTKTNNANSFEIEINKSNRIDKGDLSEELKTIANIFYNNLGDEKIQFDEIIIHYNDKQKTSKFLTKDLVMVE